jgi:trypsin
MIRLARIAFTAPLLAAALAGCVDTGADLGVSEDALIGGVPAFSARLDAIGSLGAPSRSGAIRPFCTATLIAPTVVLTAEHCLVDLDIPNTFFLIGPDARAPKRAVPIASAAAETTIVVEGSDLGSDIGVIHLAEPVTDVTPLRYAPIDPSLIGQRFSTVGYGVQNSDEDSDTRLAGSVTLRAVEGSVWAIIFGTFDNFVAHAAEIAVDPPFAPEELRPEFDTHLLIADYEAYFGGLPGDAQNCFGDSGGPVLKKIGGELTVMGVVHGGFGSTSLLCDFGGIYAVLGPAALDFVDREVALAQ